eukprot:969714-Prorocentrum_minimum.AAC.1
MSLGLPVCDHQRLSKHRLDFLRPPTSTPHYLLAPVKDVVTALRASQHHVRRGPNPHPTIVYATTVYTTTVYATTVYATAYATTVYATTGYATTAYATTVYATTAYATTAYATTAYATT